MAAVIPVSQINPRRLVDYRLMIETIRDRMVPVGVSADCFANAVALQHGYFDKMLMGLLRPFKNVEDANEIKSMMLIGVSKGFFDTISAAAPDSFYRFLKWLKTADGQTSLQQLAFEKSLAKRGQGKFSAVEVARLTMFELQLSELNNKLKAAGEAGEAEIADLERQLRQAYHKRDMRINAICNHSLSMGYYVPMTRDEFNRYCRALYFNDCQASDVRLAPLWNESLGQQPDAYFDEVQMRHSLTSVNEDADFRDAKRSRTLFVSTGAESFDEAPTPIEEEAAPENPDGPDLPPNQNDILDNLPRAPAAEHALPAAATGPQTAPNTEVGGRGHLLPQGPVTRSQASRGCGRNGGHGSRSYGHLLLQGPVTRAQASRGRGRNGGRGSRSYSGR